MADTVEIPRLKSKYNEQIAAQLKDHLGIDNVMQIPRLDKIVINMGMGRAASQPSLMDAAIDDLTVISGQKPVVTKAKKSIANFKLREGQAIGAKVTLRGDRMWEFLDRLVSVAIPRIRDFRGLPAHSWDGQGNYTFGLNEQTMFAEINPDKVDHPRGMDITIVTNATSDDAGYALLDAFGFPFKKGEDAANAPRKKRRKRPLYGKKSK
jgi:large subunit ribosomal protein L5